MLRPLLPTVWHMGALHPIEQVLTLLLAFGPFAVLGVVVWLRRREDDAQDAAEDDATDPDDEVAREAEGARPSRDGTPPVS
ncbi:hypothetical protein L2K70_04000 [Nocardioides KLBMP 9356]|uniref:Uncharacterized protein n=1 Tax=Nocardioides potassii TaxID=2911371 RepID=A0ABS9H9G2_9ACTN|nr:hypothetical protein [Nocardioides potassii]MCF6376758.1 hypothetical protein [Nocardioides potassii]